MALKINKVETPIWFEYGLSISIIVLGALAAWSLTIPDNWVDPTTKNFIGATITMLVSVAKGIELLFFKKPKVDYKQVW